MTSLTTHSFEYYLNHAAYLSMPPKQQQEAFINSALGARDVRRDSNEGIALRRQLEAVWAKVYEMKRPVLQGLRLVPRDKQTPAWAGTYIVRRYTTVGAAVRLTYYRDDLPTVTAVSSEVPGKVIGYGLALRMNWLEQMQAQNMGTGLLQGQDAAARRVLEERVDDSIAVGSPDDGTYGLFNNPDVPIMTAPVGVDGSAYWHLMRPREVLDALNAFFNRVRSQSQQTESMTTIVGPPTAISYIRTTPWTEGADTTILQQFQNSHPGVEVVDEWDRCNTAGVGGVPRLVGYTQTPDHVVAVIPMPFQLMPFQPKGFSQEAPAHCRVGGSNFLFPKSALYMDGFFDPARL